MLPDPLQFILDLAGQRKDVVQYQTAYGPACFVNCPDHISRIFNHPNYQRAKNYPFKLVLGDGILSSDGERWQQRRKLVQPALRWGQVSTFAPLITDATTAMLQRWLLLAERGPDIAEEMGRLTLDIISKALFSDQVGDQADELRKALGALIADLGDIVNTQFAFPVQFRPDRRRRFDAARQILDKTVFDLINERRRKPAQFNDLLSLLLARDGETGVTLNDEQVRDEVVTMLFAGSETTALMLTWAWSMLARCPDVERQLHEELARSLGGRLPAIDDLPGLTFTRMMLQETMRLYPPVWVIFRQALADDEIGGYPIPANAAIVVSAYAMHRHPEYWENPEQFDPERFSPAQTTQRPPYAYFPFGGGRHLCMGNQLAMMEGQLILATIAQRYLVRPVPGQSIEPLPGVTLRLRQGLKATLERRDSATGGWDHSAELHESNA